MNIVEILILRSQDRKLKFFCFSLNLIFICLKTRIFTYYEKQLENDEIVIHQLYKYTTNLIEEEAKKRDLDDTFFEILKKSVLVNDNEPVNHGRNLYKNYLESFAIYLYQIGEIRDRKV